MTPEQIDRMFEILKTLDDADLQKLALEFSKESEQCERE